MPLYLLCLTCSHQWRRWRPFKNKTRAMEGGSAVTFKITIFLWSPGNMWGPYWVLGLICVFDGIFEFLMECLLKWFFFFPLWDQLQCQIYMTGEKNAFSHDVPVCLWWYYWMSVFGVMITSDKSFTSVHLLFELQLKLLEGHADWSYS